MRCLIVSAEQSLVGFKEFVCEELVGGEYISQLKTEYSLL